ncbi:MAG TPA: sensor domain-containing diguanylate cyclase [Pseudomonadales bacterium]|nr:sensor domain-containing diguanylate cyclase [Pseudomonadales bacterium]
MLNRFLRSKFLNLRTLIVLLAFIVTAMTLFNGFHATYQVQKEQLIKQTLDTHHAYSLKLAAATDNFLISAHQQLSFSAELIKKNFDDTQLMTDEANRLVTQTASFNSVGVVNTEGIIIATSSGIPDIIGTKLNSIGVLESLQAQAPMVTTPYTSVLGNLVTLITYPIFDDSGNYLGYIGGSIYLKERGILNALLADHFHQDDSYVYVIDKNKQLIYHPDPKRIATYPKGDIILGIDLNKPSGYAQGKNSLDIEMLADFATIKTAKWGIVAQRPLDKTLDPLDNLMMRVVSHMLPLILLTFVVIWLVANLISQPLRRLADAAQRLDADTAHSDLSNISSWYFESNKLKQAMLSGLGLLSTQINQLQQDADTDPLTGALNRRGLQLLLEQMVQKRIPYSLLVIDIDYFKQVNDTFGHAAGDKALIALTQTMHDISRVQDIVARTGGEEFLLVLPRASASVAFKIAERLRTNVANLQIDPIGSITVSIGVATCSHNIRTINEVMDNADKALYQAKSLGRNRTEVFTPKD